MATEIELLSPSDKPALVAAAGSDTLETCRSVLNALGYKVHAAANAEEFTTRFAQVPYQVVILEEGAAGGDGAATLALLQSMPMNQRRHATTFLTGESFQTLDPMQAFRKSVHAVVKRSDLSQLSQVLQKVIADNTLFYGVFRDAQLRMAEGN